MHRFRLWAPNAGKVSVQVAGQNFPLHNLDGGWWEADVDPAHPGMDYAYFLDDEDLAFPDPRSPWQPDGVHGPSRLLDHAAFSWTDAAWEAPPLSAAILYELHIGTFTPEGTLDAAQTKLDSLRDLGITHLQLMPVNSFPGIQGWGYDGVDLFAPHEPYGSPDALKRFVDACHARGLAVLLDVVYNHLGPDGNYLAKFGPYFTAAHHTPWGDAVNFEDRGSHEARRFFCDNALLWLRDYHFDGLRLDAVHAYTDRSAINFMEQLATEVHALQAHTGRSYVVIAESDLNDPRLVTATEAGGYGLDAQWSDDFHHALFAILTGDRGGYYADFGSLADLAKSLREVFVYDGRYSPFRDRIHGRPVRNLPASRFLGYAQNHDQVGNRAKGDRLSSHRHQRPRQNRRRPRPHRALRPHALPGRRVGRLVTLPVLHQPQPGTGQARLRGPPQRIRRLRLEPRRHSRPAIPRNLPAFQTQLGRAQPPRLMPTCSTGTGNSSPSAAPRPTSPTPTSPTSSVRYSDAEQWLLMERGAVTVAFSLAAQPIQLEVRPGSTLALASSPDIQLNSNSLTLPPDSVAVLTSE